MKLHRLPLVLAVAMCIGVPLGAVGVPPVLVFVVTFIWGFVSSDVFDALNLP
jgi:hypothetical protein